MTDPIEATFSSFDTTELFYRAWIPKGKPARALFLFHRGHEHSGRLVELVKALNLEDFAVFAWDQRGHGRSPGERGYAPHLYDLMRDMEAFVKHASSLHGIPMENVVVFGHSVAAVIVALWVQNYAPRVRAMVLGTPALRVKLYVPFAIPALRLYHFVTQKLGRSTPFIKSYVTGKLLTHDAEQARAYDSDALISKQIAVNILLGLYDGATRVIQDAGAIRTPTLLLCARADWVVKNLPQRQFFQRLSSSVKQVQVYKGFYHSIFHESGRMQPIEDTRRFIMQAFERPLDHSELKLADRSGYTKEEYQWLHAGLPMLSVKRLCYAAQKLVMRTIGKLSQGVALGWKTGFDSGQSLDYVYANKAQGATFVGRLIDRCYLESIGWRGIRQRKINLHKLLLQTISELSSNSKKSSPLRIVDIAGGPARYVLDAIGSVPDVRFDVLIRDWSEEGLAKGQRLAQELKLSDVRYQRADAFSTESLREIPRGVDIGIVSGLYELFPDNSMVARSLQGLCEAIAPKGYLIYTNQPWHPQIEMIAEVLINRDKQPWIMRRRTQAEMDELVRQAGFEKVAMEIDNFGIFTVSLARRVQR